MSENSKGRIVSEETRRKLSEATKGENHPMYGKHHTEETKKKIGKANSRYHGKNHPLYGRKHTEEEKQKMKDNHADFKGENNPMYGVHRCGKDNPNAKSVICLTTKRIFYTAKEGAEYYKCDDSGVIKCCKGKLKTCGKHNGLRLKWKYINWNHNKKFRIKK